MEPTSFIPLRAQRPPRRRFLVVERTELQPPEVGETFAFLLQPHLWATSPLTQPASGACGAGLRADRGRQTVSFSGGWL